MTASGLMQAGEVWVSYSMPACGVPGQCKLHPELHWAGQPSLEPRRTALRSSLFAHAHGSLHAAAGSQPGLVRLSVMLLQQPQVEAALQAGGLARSLTWGLSASCS